jgi:hypothetical protein
VYREEDDAPEPASRTRPSSCLVAAARRGGGGGRRIGTAQREEAAWCSVEEGGETKKSPRAEVRDGSIIELVLAFDGV